MAFADLRAFIAHLEKEGWLKRVSAPVSRDLEIAEITDRVSKSAGGRNVALLFENVQGFDMPLLINAFGSRERMAAALGVDRLDDVSARVAKLLDLRMPGSTFDKLRKLGDLFDLAKAGPKRVRSAPCQEVVETEQPSLATLPVLRCWPGDAGRFITLPMVFTKDPMSGTRNVGMYRLQVFDDRCRHPHVEELGDTRRQLLQVLDPERGRHPLGRAEGVDEHRRVEALHALEQQGLVSLRRALRDAVGDLGDLQVAGDAGAHALEVPDLLQVSDELAEVLEGHACGRITRGSRQRGRR